MTDHYATLGVARTASADEIKRAYRKLASQHHPDKGGDVKKFQEIEQAYRVLSDPQQRQQYDNPNPFGGFEGGAPFNFDSIFDIFGARFGHQQRRPNYARMTLWISLHDAAIGGHRTVSVGTQTGTQAIDIEIPLGINEGDSIQYSGLAPGGSDLIITFRIHPNQLWQRNGQTLLTERTVDVWDLIIGGEIEVEDILGERFLLNIPPRTQPGTMLRMRGRGMPNRSGQKGDLLVRVHARIPQNIDQSIIDAITENRSKTS
jgi:DnaJ-class molecular chaperone